MKKTYIAPALKVVKLNTERMIAQSVRPSVMWRNPSL